MIFALSDRAHYNSLEQSIYLNQASLGLVGEPAVSAMHAFLDEIGRHGNMNLTDAEEVALFNPLRERAAKLMNCPADQLAIVGSAGEMLSQLPYLFDPPAGSRIVAVSSDFPAITRPWLAFAERQSIEVLFVDETPDEDLTDTVIREIDERTSVVVISYAQFSTGSLIDCRRLRAATRKAGVRFVLDVTQAAGAVPIDAAGWQPDVMVCSGYKWLGGHGGVGLAIMSPEFLERSPPAPGWMGAPDPFDMQATRLPLAKDARRYTQSTMSYLSIVGLGVAIGELLALDPARIKSHADALAGVFVAGLERSGWVPYRSLTDWAASSHIITLSHPGVGVDATLQALLDANVICSIRNGRVRVSLAHYNNEADIHSIVGALKKAAAA
ncbi:aminotransferase class V-fold PLP-dependent enzyme [Pelagibius sp. Alg239-R121]|uniref:aminotransferase class V-fold PLP-dependent enzyme n=1 Tax=Pelagibius sp. Alg239-R121 TaxID=2993448 RepID=UPI0024A6EF8E|nr:aminotransferase class V-fold PLP-dependent enzyme [Pelagibius sp. Alg239-R121]